jgi:hypothetical protein
VTTTNKEDTMSRTIRRRRAACRAAARTLAVAAALAALGAGHALAGPDERVLERQGRIDRQAAAGQADARGRAALPPQLSSGDKAAFAQAEREPSRGPVETRRRYLPPEPPMDTRSRLGVDEQPALTPAPAAPAGDRDALAIAAAVAALLLALAAATWRVHRRRLPPRPAT